MRNSECVMQNGGDELEAIEEYDFLTNHSYIFRNCPYD